MKSRSSITLPFAGFTLASLWPGVNFLGYNALELQWALGPATLVVLSLCAVLWLTGLGLALAPERVSPRWSTDRAFTVGSVGVFGLFSQLTIRSWLLESFALPANPSRAIYLAILAGALFVTQRLSRYEPVRRTVTLTAALMVAFPIGHLVRIAAGRAIASVEARPPLAEVVVPDRSRTNENIYYVILDHYAGRGSLVKNSIADIDGFLDQMRRLGYEHIDSAWTNYMTTYASLMATLQMDYILTERSPPFTDRLQFFPYAFQRGRAPRAVREALSAGYDFFHVGNRLITCRPRVEVKCLSGASDSGFYGHVAEVFLAPTRIPILMALVSGHLIPTADAMATLSDELDALTHRDRPFLAFIHNLSPHDPFRRPDCTLLLSGEVLSDHAVQERYADTIRCVNIEIQALATRIQQRDPRAIVVFQSDHGSDFGIDWGLPIHDWSDDQIAERSSILNLVRLPEPCRQWLRPGLSQINTMRLVFACVQRRPPEYLEDRTYITTYEKNPDFGIVRDVTSRLPRSFVGSR